MQVLYHCKPIPPERSLEMAPALRTVPFWNLLAFGPSDGAERRSVSFLRARCVAERRRGDVAESIACCVGGRFSGGFWSLGGRSGIRRLLEKCGSDAGFWQTQEVAGRRRLIALRGTVYDFGVWVLLLAHSDERWAGRVRLFELDLAGSRSYFVAAGGLDAADEPTGAGLASRGGEDKDSALDSVRR